MLWRHADWRSELVHVRRSRRLVVSSWANVGNYDYGFFWYFYLDGTIEVEVKLTGVPVAAAHPPGERPTHGALVASGLSAPHHQHLFCFRLDLDIDGVENSIEEVELVTDPVSPDHPRGAAFHTETTPLRTEREARRDASPAAGRFWKVNAATARNRTGEPTAYALVPGGQPALLAGAGSAVARAGGVRPAPPVGHATRRRRAPRRGRLPQPASRGRRAARLHGRQPLTREHGRRAVVHLRIEPRRPPGGLAGDARRTRRIPPPTRRLLRPQPRSRRATSGPHQPGRTLPVTARVWCGQQSVHRRTNGG